MDIRHYGNDQKDFIKSVSHYPDKILDIKLLKSLRSSVYSTVEEGDGDVSKEVVMGFGS